MQHQRILKNSQEVLSNHPSNDKITGGKKFCELFYEKLQLIFEQQFLKFLKKTVLRSVLQHVMEILKIETLS